MPISKETLDTILSLKKQLELNNEPEGRYSLFEFFNNGNIDFANDSSGPQYNKNNKTGDYVTEGIVENNCYVGKRKIIWTEKIANKEENSPALTDDLPNILMPGECICLLKDINLGEDGTKKPCYIPDRYVTIPERYIGMIKPSTKEQPGFVIVVPKLV
jgi:hypothetical protein